VSDLPRPLTDTDLDEIERRCALASEAPWRPFLEGHHHWRGDDCIRVGDLDDGPDM
jgi:hypothetical protein